MTDWNLPPGMTGFEPEIAGSLSPWFLGDVDDDTEVDDDRDALHASSKSDSHYAEITQGPRETRKPLAEVAGKKGWSRDEMQLAGRGGSANRGRRGPTRDAGPEGRPADRELMLQRGALFDACSELTNLGEPEEVTERQRQWIRPDRIPAIEAASVWLHNFLAIWRSGE